MNRYRIVERNGIYRIQTSIFGLFWLTWKRDDSWWPEAVEFLSLDRAQDYLRNNSGKWSTVEEVIR